MINKKVLSMGALLLTLCGTWALAQDAAKFVGAWKGTWEGAGAGGRFEITVERGAGGQLSGGVSVGQDTGDYVAKFSSVTIEAGELRARYPYTPDETGDIILTAKSENGALSGTWALVAKGGGADSAMANGTWNVKK